MAKNENTHLYFFFEWTKLNQWKQFGYKELRIEESFQQNKRLNQVSFFIDPFEESRNLSWIFLNQGPLSIIV